MQITIGGRGLSAGARRIADAAVDVASELGYDGLTVRSVARRAGVSGGAVQHHFPTRIDLLTAALLRTAERVAARVRWEETGSARDRLIDLGEQLLPLDEDRRQECVVWIVLSAAAATDPRLADLHRQTVRLLQHAVDEVFVDATQRSEGAAATFTALLDGLTLQGLTGASTPNAMRAILTATVDALL